jgi:MOSC domain-containing protein YiiM
MARLVSVNVGVPREVQTGRRTIRTAIWKDRVEGRVPVAGVNLRGDARWWSQRRGVDVGNAPFGENLTTEGIDLSEARIGEKWAVGSTLLEVCQPRLPCFKLGLRHGDPRFPREFALESRPGAYLRIIVEGDVGAGDAVEVIERPKHDVTCALVSWVCLHDRDRAAEVYPAADRLAAGLRDFLF